MKDSSKIKNKIMFIDKYSDLIEVFFYALILLLLVFYDFKPGENDVAEYVLDKIIDITTFSSFIVAFIITRIVRFIIDRFRHRYEDSIKLAINKDDVDMVINKYKSMSKFMPYINVNKSDVCEKKYLPGLVLDPNGYDGEVYPVEIENVEICDTKKRYELPSYVAAHKSEINRAHEGSLVYNNLNIRLFDIEFDKKIKLYTSRTTYFDSLSTNRAADYPLNDNNTLREIYEPGPFMFDLKESQFSNHLGFNLFVVAKNTEGIDGVIMVLRNKLNSVSKNKLGPSVAASLKTKYALNDDGRFDVEGLIKGIRYELVDELHIPDDNIVENEDQMAKEKWFCVGKTTKIVSFYRDLIECGKPQIVLYLKSEASFEEIEKEFLFDSDKVFENEKAKMMQKDGEMLLHLPLYDIPKCINNLYYEFEGNKYYMDPQTQTALHLFYTKMD